MGKDLRTEKPRSGEDLEAGEPSEWARPGHGETRGEGGGTLVGRPLGDCRREGPPPHPRREERSPSPLDRWEASGAVPPTGEPWAKAGRGSERGEVTAPSSEAWTLAASRVHRVSEPFPFSRKKCSLRCGLAH